jgi:hypothetical protein
MSYLHPPLLRQFLDELCRSLTDLRPTLDELHAVNNFTVLLVAYFMLPKPPLYDYTSEVTQGRMPQPRLYSEGIPMETKNCVFAEIFTRG